MGSIAVDRINGGWWSSRGGNHKAREGRGCGSKLEERQSRKKRPVMILKKQTGSGVISAFKKKKKSKKAKKKKSLLGTYRWGLNNHLF